MNISFCLPEEYFPNESWRDAFSQGKALPLEESGKIATTHSWIYQTWALLSMITVPCSLFPQMPENGIIIVLSGSLPKSCKTPKDVFLVDIVADGLPHPAAHLHIVQNRAHAQRLRNSLFMPHWPQPGLIKRNSERGDHFENISFFGHLSNLATELQSPSWINRLRDELGLHLNFCSANRWNDYSTTDGVIAIRDFSTSRQLHKPATKLYNAWLAGVPFIGGLDSAYAADGEPEKNYLVATSPEDVFMHLKRLKEDRGFRKRLVLEGQKAGVSFTQNATLERWHQLVEKTLPHLATQWFDRLGVQQQLISLTNRAACFADRYVR